MLSVPTNSDQLTTAAAALSFLGGTRVLNGREGSFVCASRSISTRFDEHTVRRAARNAGTELVPQLYR